MRPGVVSIRMGTPAEQHEILETIAYSVTHSSIDVASERCPYLKIPLVLCTEFTAESAILFSAKLLQNRAAITGICTLPSVWMQETLSPKSAPWRDEEQTRESGNCSACPLIRAAFAHPDMKIDQTCGRGCAIYATARMYGTMV